MTQRIIYWLILLAGGIGLGVYLLYHPEIIVIQQGNLLIRVPLWLGCFMVIIAMVSISCILIWGHYILKTPHRWWHQYKAYRGQKAKRLTEKGLIQFMEGKWDLAEKYLIKGTKYNSISLINYLTAARVAQEQEDLDRRDHYLSLAYQSTQGSEVAVGLTQAHLQMLVNQQEEALATLQYLRTLVPNHRYVLKLLKNLHLTMQDWLQLSRLLPDLVKYSVLDKEAFEDLACIVYKHLLQTYLHQGSLNLMKQQWQELPYELQKKSILLISYIKGLLQLGAEEEAERLLIRRLKYKWEDELVKCYSEIQYSSPEHRLLQAEKWLNQQGPSATLLGCLAQLATQCQLWGKALTYLQRLCQEYPSSVSYEALGQWYERKGEVSTALEYYKQGLHLAKQ